MSFSLARSAFLRASIRAPLARGICSMLNRSISTHNVVSGKPSIISSHPRSFGYMVTLTRDDLIQVALENVKTMGWTEEAVSKALRDNNSNEKLSIVDVASNFIFNANQETIAELRNDEAFKTMSTRDQLVHAMMTRLMKNIPYRSHGIGLLKLAMNPASPIRSISAQLFAYEIWQLIKDNSPNQVFSERKNLLVSAYATAELAFANDNTPDFELTRSTIQQQIDGIPNFNMDLLKNVGGVGAGSQPGPNAEAASKFLNAMLAAMEKSKGGNPMEAMKEMFSGPNAPSKADMDAMMDMIAKTQGIDASGPFGKAKLLGELLKKIGK